MMVISLVTGSTSGLLRRMLSPRASLSRISCGSKPLAAASSLASRENLLPVPACRPPLRVGCSAVCASCWCSIVLSTAGQFKGFPLDRICSGCCWKKLPQDQVLAILGDPGEPLASNPPTTTYC